MQVLVSRPPIFDLQQDVLKISHISMSWASPKTGLEAIF